MRLTDTLTGELRDLPAPLDEDGNRTKIGMYVCGPTVYQRAHIGNARPYVVFSWLARWLKHRGYEATSVTLPAPPVGVDSNVLAPAEVEL